MNDPRLDSDINEFYQSIKLDPAAVDRIASGIQLAESARSWKRAATCSLIALAASIALIAFLVTRTGEERSGDFATSGQIAGQSIVDQADESTDQNKGVSSEDAEPQYQLVAVRSHGDNCPFCSATEDAFVELKDSLKDQSIGFQRIDLSDRSELETTKRKIDQLHLTSLVNGRSETAFLVLTNRDGTEITEFKPSQPIKRITSKIIEAIQP